MRIAPALLGLTLMLSACSPQPESQEAVAARQAAKAAFAEIETREGVTRTDSGLMYEVLKTGAGEKPVATDTVVTHYHGTLVDGTVFDSSYDRGEPASLPLNRVIRGWTEALTLMPVGSKWRLYVPPELAYGKRGAPPKIGPDTPLIFEVELLEIVR